MVVSLKVMSDGRGVDYLLHSVVAGDGDRALGTPLTRYYQEAGTPPGTWLGSGLADLGSDDAELIEGDAVTEAQMRALIADARDPITGERLGSAHAKYTGTRGVAHGASGSAAPSHATRDGATGAGATSPATASRARTSRNAVSGYDLTFSAPKSVSALWAVADAGTQTLIARAHHDALRSVIDLLERRVADARIGKGGAARIGVRGVIAAAFDHYDSRAGDPQLHTHVVIANRVLGIDGKWRALYSKPLHGATVALSETYNAILMDRLTSLLGVGWAPVDRGADRNAGWEIDGVPGALVAAFSSRSQSIAVRTAVLVASYAEAHGHQPSATAVIKLRQRATLETRGPKQVASLAELTNEWRYRTRLVLGQDATTWASALVAARGSVPLLRGDDLAPSTLDDLAAVVLMEVGSRRATWRRWNLWAEAARQTMGVRFATALDREAVLEAVVARAEAGSVRLTPVYDRSSPGIFDRGVEGSAFQPQDTVAYSSQAILDAEARLLAAAGVLSGPQLSLGQIEQFTLWPTASGRTLADDQVLAVMRLATSGRALDVLVGPAGAGKTTALLALRMAWERSKGPGSVVGLAPSAAAAEVLGDALGIRTENTAKWSFEHNRGEWDFQRGQLVLVDEASLAGTLLLDRLVAHAGSVGAKVVLVGDWAQLTAIETGGAFGMLARTIEDVPELTDVRRFQADWEKQTSLGLRHGDPAVLPQYVQRDRLHSSADAGEDAYGAWSADRAAGRLSVLIAADSATVTALGARARADRIAVGLVAVDGVDLHDGNLAGVGDEIVTRQNDRRLTAGKDRWVKNGDRWQVTHTFDDGALAVRRLAGGSLRGETVVLPAAYVASHVELGYAITVHRTQGLTVDTAHAIIDPSTATRELLYVAMTRGAQANHVYVSASPVLDDDDHVIEAGRPAEDALAEVMARVGAEQSATETLRLEVDSHSSLSTLVAELRTITAHVVSIGAGKWPKPDSTPARVGDLLTLPEGRVPTAYARAIMERAKLIDAAADHLASEASTARESWTRRVSSDARTAVALYRAIYGVTGERPLGDPGRITDRQQRIHYDRARRLAARPRPIPSGGYSHSHSVTRESHGLGL